jgi:predicted phosphodiesterase
MKIAVFSDLHLEVSSWSPPERTLREADLIVLAGDISTHTNGLEWARTAFPEQRIVYVAGNHEFYGSEIHGLQKELRATALRLGIDFLECDEVVIDGVRILGTTLWTDFQLYGAGEAMGAAMNEASRFMLDFSRIRYSPMPRFQPSHSVSIHRQSRFWLSEKLAEPFNGKTVVVTHHAPSMQSIATNYANSPMSAAFASNLDDLVVKADLWIHGHTHTAFRYQVGEDPSKGHVVCNPRGYRWETYAGDKGENTGWSPRLLIDLDRLGVPHYREDPELRAWMDMPDVGREIINE